MDYKIIESENLKYIEILSCEFPMSKERDALDLVGLCGEHFTNLIMIHSEALSEDFFRLSTGVAGGILQKFVNYSIKSVAIVPSDKTNTGKFKDMAIEANRGNHFRVFENKIEAEEWLLGK